MVISTGALHSWKNPVKSINECYRVLKPGREAWILDPAQIVSDDKWRGLVEGFDWIAYLWVSLTSRLVKPKNYSIGEIKEIIATTNFKNYEIENKDELRIKLRK